MRKTAPFFQMAEFSELYPNVMLNLSVSPTNEVLEPQDHKSPHFHTYPSITSFSKQASVTKLCQVVPESEVWYVTEKIHGANFQLRTDGKVVQAGTRNKFVDDADLVNFHHCGEVIEANRGHILKLFEELQTAHACKEVVVYGELFGGQYPGFPKTTKPVQKQIQYCPKVTFAGLDILMDSKFLDKPVSDALLANSGMFHVCNLFAGTKEEAFAYSVSHFAEPTTVPTWFELEPIVNQPNVREGHVIQPGGVYFCGFDRVIFKHKNELWSESCKSNKPVTSGKMAESELFQEAVEMITPTRVSNVLSHFTNAPHRAKLIGLVVQDIIDELSTSVDKKQKQKFAQQLGHEVKSKMDEWEA
jgi:Rnl2 family RNA ligase